MTPQKFSQGIEKVIWLAALDKEFRSKLHTERKAALEDCEVELSDSETAVLMSIPGEQLEAAIKRVKVPAPARRAFLRGAAITALAIIGSTIIFTTVTSGMSSTKGITPYVPPCETWKDYAGRTCLVYTPNSYRKSVPVPLVLMYHGENEDAVKANSCWKKTASNDGFILCCTDWSGNAGDVAAEAETASQIVSEMKSDWSIRAGEVFIGGFSTGGQVALTSGLSLDGSWRGIFSWAGLLPDGIDPANAPRMDMLVYLGAGESDAQVPAADVEALVSQLDGLGFREHYEKFPGGHDSGIFSAPATWAWISS